MAGTHKDYLDAYVMATESATYDHPERLILITCSRAFDSVRNSNFGTAAYISGMEQDVPILKIVDRGQKTSDAQPPYAPVHPRLRAGATREALPKKGTPLLVHIRPGQSIRDAQI